MSTLNDDDRENLTAYLDGELDEAAAQALEAKINLDPQARAEVDAMRQTWGLLDYLPRPAPSTSFTNRTMERLSLEQLKVSAGTMPIKRPINWLAPLGWAAAILIAASAGFGLSQLWMPKAKDHAELDEALVRHMHVLENWRQLEHADDLDFLRALDHPDLFGEEQGS